MHIVHIIFIIFTNLQLRNNKRQFLEYTEKNIIIRIIKI